MMLDGASSEGRGARSARAWRTRAAAAALAFFGLVAFAPSAGAKAGNGLFGGGLLQPLDPLVEDVLVPDVLGPANDVVPSVDALVPIGLAGPVPVQPVNDVNAALYEPLGALQPQDYEYEVENSGGRYIVEQGRARVGVPLALSISDDVLPDILVDVTDVETTPTVRVIRLPGAPSRLDLSVKVTVAPKGWSHAERYEVHMFGGSFESGFPDMAKVTVTGLGPNPQFGVQTVNPGQNFHADVTQTGA